MAILINGILGGFSGKVGSVVGARYRGQNIIRSLPVRNRLNDSPKQMIQKAKFGLATGFVHQLASIYDITYKHRAGKATPRNIAISDIVVNAITGVYPDFHIDYSKVMISSGNLHFESANVTITAGKITWSWVPMPGLNGAQENDQSVIVVYCPEKKHAIYKFNAGMRGDGMAILDVQPLVGFTVVTYLGFTSLNQCLISNSVFTGQFWVN